MFENSIFKIEFSILLGLFPHHNLYRLTFQSFVLREYICYNNSCPNIFIRISHLSIIVADFSVIRVGFNIVGTKW